MKLSLISWTGVSALFFFLLLLFKLRNFYLHHFLPTNFVSHFQTKKTLLQQLNLKSSKNNDQTLFNLGGSAFEAREIGFLEEGFLFYFNQEITSTSHAENTFRRVGKSMNLLENKTKPCKKLRSFFQINFWLKFCL